MEAAKRLLRVALIGAPNAGKSTLLNRLTMSEISCVSNKVHTTRRNTLGVYTQDNTQIEFYDSPGYVTKKHVLRHHLEDSLLNGPKEAAQVCDLIAVVVDVSNPRGSWRLSSYIMNMLHEHEDKKSCLILNKVDLLKEKRMLIDMGVRLTEGHLEGKPQLQKHELRKLLHRQGGLGTQRKPSPYVIDLDHKPNDDFDENAGVGFGSKAPPPLGYRNFSQVYSISALKDDGVDELREDLIQRALPVEAWPHGAEYLSNLSTKDLVHSIIRGNLMDCVDREIPYVVKYKYLKCTYDEVGSLHIELEILVPKKYMIGRLLGEHGVVIFKITNESRDRIATMMGCDVKLNITVNSTPFAS